MKNLSKEEGINDADISVKVIIQVLQDEDLRRKRILGRLLSTVRRYPPKIRPMKTFPAIYIDSQGELKCITDVNQSAIPVSGDEYKQIPSDYYERLKGMEIVEIPEGWRVEVREELEYPIDHTSYPPYIKVAVLIPPSEKEESQAELCKEIALLFHECRMDPDRSFRAEMEMRFTIQRRP